MLPLRQATVVLFVALGCCAQSQTTRPLTLPAKEASDPSRRIALLIGNSDYLHSGKLTNPINDVDSMEVALKQVGFEVMLVKNATRRAMIEALGSFSDRLQGGYGVALCFYAGHGLQVQGENYLIPVDANPQRETEVEFECVPANRFLRSMEDGRISTRILLLDACRNNPLPRSWGRDSGGGLAFMAAPSGTFIGFATAPGQVALDGRSGANSPYTAAILRHLRAPGLDIAQVFTRVARTTQESAAKEGRSQVPFQLSSLTGEFYFVPPTEGEQPRHIEAPVPVYQAYIPDVYVDSLVGRFVRVRGATFTMGCTDEQMACYSNERPKHRVVLSDYYIGETEVTQSQWRRVMGKDPASLAFPGCDDCPVEMVSWEDVQVFMERLNDQRNGVRYRLPTEAEWEYAARGGRKAKGYPYAGSKTIGAIAWFETNSGGRTHPVKEKKPNELGLYDMSGNVWEWCADWFGDYPANQQNNPKGPSMGSSKVNRGGSFLFGQSDCRTARRGGYAPNDRRNNLGFRLVSDL